MATNGIVLSSSVRTNLLSLQDTTTQQGIVQNRLATGKKVISALDNPTNFFTSAGLTQRANDLAALLDGISNGVKTLEAASNGATSITKVLESMQANVRQARQDKSFKGELFSLSSSVDTSAVRNITISGGSVTGAVNIPLNTVGTPATAASRSFTFGGAMSFDDAGDQLNFSIAIDGGASTAVSITAADVAAVGNNDAVLDDAAELRAVLAAKLGSSATIGGSGTTVSISSNSTGAASRIAITGVSVVNGGGAALTNTSGLADGSATGTATTGLKTIDEIADAINSHPSLTGKVRASNDGGKLRIENLSVKDMTVAGVNSTTGQIDGSGGTKTIALNEIRKNLVAQFNDLRDQLDKIASDAGYNGVNLLRGDKLRVVFNERGTSSIDIEAKNKTGPSGVSTAANSLNIPPVTEDEYSSDDLLDARFNALKDSLTTLQSQSSNLGANLGVVQIRQDFTKQMITTLQTGSDFLVNADMNEEGANLLALNTRQQLSQTALSLASQADQAVLRLFG
ncbi:flagellin [Enterovirga aerilata]|uniref:Flagellin n=1 Tax=Enterovirga aerilata TaxID=2730920 RepID=A0A849I4F3_9HYPH|nr:flagellin [Enterovirga sp. DB1703]NNM74706.1 hypothetical protein [Enterovirga sp. DB1703]